MHISRAELFLWGPTLRGLKVYDTWNATQTEGASKQSELSVAEALKWISEKPQPSQTPSKSTRRPDGAQREEQTKMAAERGWSCLGSMWEHYAHYVGQKVIKPQREKYIFISTIILALFCPEAEKWREWII